MNIVSIMAHQDDEMRCLGTMLKCKNRGDKLYFINVTDGSNGVLNENREEAARIRFEEMSKLASEIDAKYICLGKVDEFLYDTPEVRKSLIEVIRKTKANIIFTHYFNDYNLDHTTVAELVRHCAMLSCIPVIKTKSKPLKDHPAIFMIEPHGPINFPATHFVDITEYEDHKVELLKNHKSQEEAMQLAVGAGLKKLVNRPDAYWGEQVGCEYAECFIPMPGRGAIKPYSVLP